MPSDQNDFDVHGRMLSGLGFPDNVVRSATEAQRNGLFDLEPSPRSPNDADRRSVGFAMSPTEALLALESFSIGAATMLASENRGRPQASAIRALADRLVAATGLSPRLAGMLADGSSGVFRLLDAIAPKGVATVVLRLDRDDRSRSKDRVLAVVDGKPRFLTTINPSLAETRDLPSGDFWKRQEALRRHAEATFDAVVEELTSFLRSEAHVDVEFLTETPLEIAIPRTLVAERSDAAVNEAAGRILDLAFRSRTGADAIVAIAHDLWNDGETVSVRLRAVVPSVMRAEAADRLEAAVEALDRPTAGPGRKP